MIGLNVSSDGRHDGESLAGLGVRGARVVLRRDVDLVGRLLDWRDHGISTLAVIARESVADYGDVEDDLIGTAAVALADYSRRYSDLIASWEVGNEPDLDSPSSWTLPADRLTALGQLARNALPGRTLVLGGLASGQPPYLDGVDLGWCDAIGLHPYAKDMTPGNDLPDVDELVVRYQRFGKPIWITEWGWWSTDEERGAREIADVVGWAARTDQIEAFYYFCADDLMVAPFGLFRLDGSPKPAVEAFRSAALAVPAPVQPAPADPSPPQEPVMPTLTPWEYFTAEQIAEASVCPVDAITMYWPKIVEQLDHCGINDRATQVAAIGTIAIETASTFRPIHEYGTPADWAGYSGGARYAGRGFIQLTHDYNYAAYGQAVDELWHAGGAIDLVARPDDALDPDVAAAVLACYFRDHTTAQGYSIPQAANAGDWTWVRRLVQGGTAGLDRLVAVAGALQAAPEPAPVVVADDPRDERIRGLEGAVAHLADVVVPKAARAAQDADAAVAEAVAIREQFLGPKAAA